MLILPIMPLLPITLVMYRMQIMRMMPLMLVIRAIGLPIMHDIMNITMYSMMHSLCL